MAQSGRHAAWLDRSHALRNEPALPFFFLKAHRAYVYRREFPFGNLPAGHKQSLSAGIARATARARARREDQSSRQRPRHQLAWIRPKIWLERRQMVAVRRDVMACEDACNVCAERPGLEPSACLVKDKKNAGSDLTPSDWIGIAIIRCGNYRRVALVNQITKPYDVKDEGRIPAGRKEGGC